MMQARPKKTVKSTLTREAAEAATAGWQTAKEKMERLEEMIIHHNEQAWAAFTDELEEETNDKNRRELLGD